MALSTPTATLSYGQLYERSTQLAHLLRSNGIDRGATVGVCTGRSYGFVIGLLGSLLAGATYLPLDPANPPDRLAFMARDANASLILTDGETGRAAMDEAAKQGMRMFDLERETHLLAAQSTTDLAVFPSGEDVAYIIYTSGSTGRPKGVEITHNNLLNLVRWHLRAFAVTASDRASQLSSPAFDAAGWELWPYLAVGASVHMADEATRSNPQALRDWLLRERITLSFAPTPLAEQLLALDWPPVTSLRTLLTGADTLRRWPPAGLPFTLVNNYGPSECTVVATAVAVSAGGHTRALPPIGFPIDGAEVTIRDHALRPVPCGEVGEICISGRSVGRGYRNRPELTARVFTADPSGATGRLYRTGDCGRVLDDGQIAFLGRIDDQIKLRGYRIEPGEIVAVLSQHPDILASTVVCRGETPNTQRLVAYVAPRPDAILGAAELREYLSARLPDYMVPAVFVHLESLPLGANGKIDRSALPSPTAENILQPHQARVVSGEAIHGASVVGAAMLSPIEGRVASIVENLLGVKGCALDDNFFMLGGHSLLGAQLVIRLGETFGVECSLRTLFEAPTIRQLSRAVEDLILAKIDAKFDAKIDAVQPTPAYDTGDGARSGTNCSAVDEGEEETL